MNEKVFAVIIILLFMTSALVIFSSESANAPQPLSIIQKEHITNDSLYYHTSNYTVNETFNSTHTNTKIYIGNYNNVTADNFKPAQTFTTDTSSNTTSEPLTYFDFEGNDSIIYSKLKALDFLVVNIQGTALIQNGSAVTLNYAGISVYLNPEVYGFEVNSLTFYYTEPNGTANSNIYDINVNLTPSNTFYNDSSFTFVTSPYLIAFSPYQYTYSSSADYLGFNNYLIPTYIFTYTIYNYSPTTHIYKVTFNSNTNFHMDINGTNYTSAGNQLIVYYPSGSYSYSSWTTNYSNRTYGSFTIVNKNLTIQLVLLSTQIVQSVQLGIFLIAGGTLLFFVINRIRGFLAGTAILSLLYVFIGYKLNIEYFNTNMILYIAMVLSAGIVYLFILRSE